MDLAPGDGSVVPRTRLSSNARLTGRGRCGLVTVRTLLPALLSNRELLADAVLC
jgi:hypothetical protein